MIARPIGLRRWAISVFVVVALLAQVTQNLNVAYFADVSDADPPARAAAWVAERIRWGIGQFGFYTGTNTYWRMFSPVHRIDWWWSVVAVDPDGRERVIPAPEVGGASWSSVLLGFRDAKLMLNLWNQPSMQAAYLDHRCLEEGRVAHAPAAIRLELHWRDIVRPDLAAATGRHVSADVKTRAMATRTCQ